MRGSLRTIAIKIRTNLVDQNNLTPQERALNSRNMPKPLFFNTASMEILRRMYLVSETNKYTAEVSKLIALANQMIGLAEFSVTDKGRSHVPGVDVHYYQNIGLYDWQACDLPDNVWTNRSTKLKLPDSHQILSGEVPVRDRTDCFTYFIWDGKVRQGGGLWSKGSELYDRTRSYDFHSNFTMYALAYYYTNDPRYAEKAVRLARRWWLNPKTAMRPTMQYVSFDRNIAGRSYGIIELKDLSWALDSVYLLQQSPTWTDDDAAALKQWCMDYHTWLTDPKSFSHKESTTKNNHGWYYMLQTAAVWKCAGATDSELGNMLLSQIKDLVDKTNKKPKKWTFGLAGDLPRESKRGRAVHYHYFTLYAMILTWRASESLGLSTTSLPLQEFENGLVRTVQTVLNSSSLVRRSLADEDKFTESELHERGTLLCAWLRDVAVSRQTLERQQIDGLCGNLPLKPPVVPTDPHSGIFPFFSMW